MQRDELAKSGEDSSISVSRGGLEIRRQGKPVGGELPSQGLVYLAIDCSASMAGAKLLQAKLGALDFFGDAKAKGYHVGLVRFDTHARLICEPQRELEVLRRYVQELERGISTNMSAGIELASEMLRGRSGSRAIVVVTDGMPDSKEDTLAAAAVAKGDEIDIITIGTDDADQSFLRELASRTELNVMVSSDDLGRGIASTAKMLPEIGSHRGLQGS